MEKYSTAYFTFFAVLSSLLSISMAIDGFKIGALVMAIIAASSYAAIGARP